MAVLHLCAESASSAAAAEVAASGRGGWGAGSGAPSSPAVLGSGPAALEEAAGLLAAIEVQQLGQQVSFVGTPAAGAAAGGGGLPLLRRQAARAAVAARAALAVHDAITGGKRQSWRVITRSAASAQAKRAPPMPSIAGSAAPASGAGAGPQPASPAVGAAAPRRTLRSRFAVSARDRRRAPLAPPSPPSSAAAAAAAPASPPAHDGGSPPAAAAGDAAAGDAEAGDTALWRQLPLARRIGYHVHIALRMLWLAAMGDPSYWQDAIDLIGPKSAAAAQGRGGAAAAQLALLLPVWVGYCVRVLVLRALKMVATLSQVSGGQVNRLSSFFDLILQNRQFLPPAIDPLSIPHLKQNCMATPNQHNQSFILSKLHAHTPNHNQALTFQAYRWTLWWWPGLHAVLLAVARGGAVTGISIYDSLGSLHRTLRFSRQGISTRFYRWVGAVARSGGSLAALHQSLTAAATAASERQAAAQIRRPSGGSAAGQAAVGEQEVLLDEEGVTRAAAQLAMVFLGIAGGDIGE
jgi:hypothetical protein